MAKGGRNIRRGVTGAVDVAYNLISHPLLLIFMVALLIWVSWLPIEQGGLGLFGYQADAAQTYLFDRVFPYYEVDDVVYRYFDVFEWFKSFAEGIGGVQWIAGESTNALVGWGPAVFSGLTGWFDTDYGNVWDILSNIFNLLVGPINILIGLVNLIMIPFKIIVVVLVVILRNIVFVMPDSLYDGLMVFFRTVLPYLHF